jgi:putative addiction module killer protein
MGRVPVEADRDFGKWLSDLRDIRAKARILARLESARLGNLGDARSIGDGVSELRIDVGAGLSRVFHAPSTGRNYFAMRR